MAGHCHLTAVSYLGVHKDWCHVTLGVYHVSGIVHRHPSAASYLPESQAYCLAVNNKLIDRLGSIDLRFVAIGIGSSAPFRWWAARRPCDCVRSVVTVSSSHRALKRFLDPPVIFTERWQARLAGGGRLC